MKYLRGLEYHWRLKQASVSNLIYVILCLQNGCQLKFVFRIHLFSLLL